MALLRYAYMDEDNNIIPCDSRTWESRHRKNRDGRIFRTISFSNNWSVYAKFSGLSTNENGPPRFWRAFAYNPFEHANYDKEFETLPEAIEWYEHIVEQVRGMRKKWRRLKRCSCDIGTVCRGSASNA